MSTGPGPGPPQTTTLPRHGGLAKYVKRLSTVFKRDKPARTTAAPASSSPSSHAPPPAATAAPAPTHASALAPSAQNASQEGASDAAAPAPSSTNITPASTTTAPPPPATASPAATAPIAAAAAAAASPTTTTTPAPPSATRVLDRSAMQQERARALFAKYGLALESHEWITTPAPFPTVQRVEKPVRMRVHRSCHRCGTIYGADKVCFNCEHKRCKKCPRYPKKRTPEEKLKDSEVEAVEKPRRKKVLTITTKSGNELAYQPPKQRIRRICHKCDSHFIPPTATVCEQCQHVRCTKCPREPSKLTKWPKGYPGDAEALSDSEVENQLKKFRRTWRKPRARIRWECEQCHNVFLNGSSECHGCGHERCSMCTRSPAKKIKKEEQFDPLIVAAVEAKLRELAVSDDTTTSGAEAT